MRLCSIVFLGLLVFASRSFAQAADVGDYVWAGACKDCHAAQYNSWEQTKHAHTITRLSAEERATSCAACHVTAGDHVLDQDVNASVQCERCHGAGKAHIQAAAAGAAKPASIVAKPGEQVCVGCHSDKSPHFKFFSYPALAPLVHTKK